MQNKVIIDGCNVAECMELHTKEGYAEICYMTNGCCKHNPNCYYKQLQRAKAELEQYKKSKQASYETMQTQWNYAVGTLRDVEAENEKLKKEVKEIRTWEELKLSKYRKALENIDFIIDQSCILCNEEEMATCDLTTCRNGKMQMIKEIKNVIDELIN